ncbi:MAG: hypothetical protein ACREL1_08255 [bacterium]
METMSLAPTKNSSYSLPLFDLSRPFEKIVRSWGAEEILRLPSDSRLDDTLTLERSVALTGTLTGFLNFRTTPEFSSWLRNQQGPSSAGLYSEDEVFDEMISLFGLYLFHDFWNPESFQIGPLQPLSDEPTELSFLPPHAVSRLRVENQMVEIRLWMRD